jgi:hypothetical protein
VADRRWAKGGAQTAPSDATPLDDKPSVSAPDARLLAAKKRACPSAEYVAELASQSAKRRCAASASWPTPRLSRYERRGPVPLEEPLPGRPMGFVGSGGAASHLRWPRSLRLGSASRVKLPRLVGELQDLLRVASRIDRENRRATAWLSACDERERVRRGLERTAAARTGVLGLHRTDCA